MKANKKVFIILLCISIVLLAVAAVMMFFLKPKVLFFEIGSWVLFGGITVLLFAIINYVTKRRVEKRYATVKNAYRNMGEGIYVQGMCGSKKQDKADGLKNSAQFTGALLFASLFGTGVYTISSSRHRMEYYIIGSEMYAGEFKLGNWGYEYGSTDNMHAVYKGWFARHTVEVKRKKIILTGADGHSYFSFDLNTCNVSKERLLSELENVFGTPENASEIEQNTPPSPSPFKEF